MNNVTFYKTLDKKTRKLYISYPIEDISKDYEIIKQIVYSCREKGLCYYFTIDSNRTLRNFIIFSEDWNELKDFYGKL